MLKRLEAKGFEEPTTIQSLAIPRLLKPGPAFAAKARTGTGKTAAFGIPILERISAQERTDSARPDAPGRKPQALVLVPTRELALQVTEELNSLKEGAYPAIACVYGGASIGEQLRKLSRGVDIVVGTPGRVLDHLSRRSLDLSALGFFVLDEADEMLDMGFVDDIRAVMGTMNTQAQILLFSATLDSQVLDIVRERTGEIEIVRDDTETLPTELAEQLWIEVHAQDRLEALSRIVDSEDGFYGIVFVSTKIEADKVAASLSERGYDAEALHGDLGQDARERVLGKFRDKRISILVATDVAARGIDIERLSHVINWSLPHDPESYIHRIGRTGRAGHSGTAITFVTPQESRLLFRIRRGSGGLLKKAGVPGVEGILSSKRERIIARIESRASAMSDAEGAGASDGEADSWRNLARSVLASQDPETALAAALAEGFAGYLDATKYRELTEVGLDAGGSSRLFIGVGKRDGVTPRTLVAMIQRLANLPGKLIGGVEILENFSFLTVPVRYGEAIIEAASRAGGFPAVRKATPRGDRVEKRRQERDFHARGASDSPARKSFRTRSGPREGYGRRGKYRT